MNTTKPSIVILIVILISFIIPSYALSAGVSPPKIIIENAIPGNSYKITLTVYNTGNQTTSYMVEQTGNIKNWIFLDKNKVVLEGNSTYKINGTINLPSNLTKGTYKGNVLIKSVPSGNLSGNKVSVGVQLPITINATNIKEIKSEMNQPTENNSSNLNNNNTIINLDDKQTTNFIIGILIAIIVILLFINKRRKNK